MTTKKLPQSRCFHRLASVCVRASTAVLLSSALLNVPVRAAEGAPNAEKEEPVKLSQFSVRADAYKGYVASSTLIGGKTAQAIVDVPQTVNVITRDLIDDMGTDIPIESLSRIAPGVTPVASEGSSSAGAYIRGFRSQNWSIDGATMRGLSLVTNFNTDAIEVIKGPASVTFGAFAA